MTKKLHLLLVLLAWIPLNQFAQTGESQEEMMKAYMESIAPTKEHKLFAHMEGEWQSVNTYWMVPGAPPEKSEGFIQSKMIMGGRYLHETIKSNTMGMPMEGMSILAFDRNKGKFINTWIDNFGTGIMVFEGEQTGETQITLLADYFDPMTQEEQVHKQVLDISDKTHSMNYYVKGSTGEWTKTMEIVYKKAK